MLNNQQITPSKILFGEEQGLTRGWLSSENKSATKVSIDKKFFQLGENEFIFMVINTGSLPNPAGFLANIIISYSNNIPADIIKTDASIIFNGDIYPRTVRKDPVDINCIAIHNKYVPCRPGDMCLQIGQLAVYTIENGVETNVATRGKAFMSSLWNTSTPNLAINGILAPQNFPITHSGGCDNRTWLNNNEWWILNLDKSYNIYKIVYYNRMDLNCCHERAYGTEVLLFSLNDMPENRSSIPPSVATAMPIVTYTLTTDLVQPIWITLPPNTVSVLSQFPQPTDIDKPFIAKTVNIKSTNGYSTAYGGGVFLQISQVAVYTIVDGIEVNIAPLGRATASSTFNAGTIAQNAVDGTLSVKPHGEKYYCSSEGRNEEWRLDLDKEYPIYKVVYYNRDGCCQLRAMGTELILTDNSGTKTRSYTLNGDDVQKIIVSVPKPVYKTDKGDAGRVGFAVELGSPDLSFWSRYNFTMTADKSMLLEKTKLWQPGTSWQPGTEWIGGNPFWNSSADIGLFYFEKIFILDEERANIIRSAKMYMIADDIGNFAINGVKNNGGPNDYTTQYINGSIAYSFDIASDKFSVGENQITFSIFNLNNYKNASGLIANLVLIYNDVNIPIDVIKTDYTWQYYGRNMPSVVNRIVPITTQPPCSSYSNKDTCNDNITYDCYYINTVCRDKIYFNSNIKDVNINTVKTLIMPIIDNDPNPTFIKSTNNSAYNLVIIINLDDSPVKSIRTNVSISNILIKALYLCDITKENVSCNNIFSNINSISKSTMRTFNNVSSTLSPLPEITEDQYKILKKKSSYYIVGY